MIQSCLCFTYKESSLDSHRDNVLIKISGYQTCNIVPS